MPSDNYDDYQDHREMIEDLSRMFNQVGEEAMQAGMLHRPVHEVPRHWQHMLLALNDLDRARTQLQIAAKHWPKEN